MKSLRSILFALTVLAMATATQAQQTHVKATIPFDFVVGDRAYTAGEYDVKSIGNSNTAMRIDSTQEGNGGFVLSNKCSQAAPSGMTKLVFHRVGDNYFLYQIWVAGNTTGSEFPVSRTETQLSQYREKPRLVIVAASISH